LERDDRPRFGELLLELARTPLEFDLACAGLRSWSGTTTPGRESLDAVLAQIAPPDGEMRLVQPFATKDSTDLARLRARVGLADDAGLELSGEPPACGACDHFRIGIGAPRGVISASLRSHFSGRAGGVDGCVRRWEASFSPRH